jgi:hypothetical protein
MVIFLAGAFSQMKRGQFQNDRSRHSGKYCTRLPISGK